MNAFLNKNFQKSISTAIAAGLGALHVKDRVSSINEIEMDDIIPAATNLVKKAGRFIANKTEDMGINAFARTSANNISHTAENMKDKAMQMGNALSKNVSRLAQDYRDEQSGNTGIFNGIKKTITRGTEDLGDNLQNKAHGLSKSVRFAADDLNTARTNFQKQVF